MDMKKKTLIAPLLALFLCSQAWAATFQVDPDHSSVSFKIRHLISKTQGQFNKFEGTIEFEAGKPETWAASGTIQTASIDTNNEKRDAHLKTADFFDAEKFPTIEFRTTGVKESTENTAKVEGVLKMHGVEKPILLDVTLGGTVKDPWGNERIAFSAKTTVNRKDFGMTYNQALDAGGLMLGEDVEIDLEIEGIKK
jgi:polyisoprenoid-binding protein YceI